MKIVNKPIEMIAWFTDAGSIKPVKFRVKDEEQINKVFKINKIVTKSEEKLAGNRMLIFRCQSAIDGIERLYEIKYELSTCKWILFKI
ncbi:MAG: hypothetical protein PHI32_13310 [Dysgonamonadaceae bacterium]|nr:hypothetical protein [Dysgonamonadaceae bacterium]